MNNQKNKKKVIIAGIVFSVLLILVGVFILKPLHTLNNATSPSEFGFNESYKQVRKRCPTNIELQPTCLKAFYAKESTKNIQDTLQSSLKDKGYEIKTLAKGYDGPDQKAYAAYNSAKDVSTIIIIIETENTAYKMNQGNVRVESTIGKNNYNNHQ